jgi:hypothetical protein
MSRELCGDDESFIRGITSAHYDEGELSADFFEGKATSVSRLCFGDEVSLARLLKGILAKTQSNVDWKGYATFEHARLKEETEKYVATNKALKQSAFKIWVEAAPTDDDPGHAEVMPRVPRGLANYLMFKVDLFSFHTE